MKRIIFIVVLFLSCATFAQTRTEPNETQKVLQDKYIALQAKLEKLEAVAYKQLKALQKTESQMDDIYTEMNKLNQEYQLEEQKKIKDKQN